MSSGSAEPEAALSASRSEQVGSVVQPPDTVVSAGVLTLNVAASELIGASRSSAKAAQKTGIDLSIPYLVIVFKYEPRATPEAETTNDYESR
jgi:hypothetical protein